MFTDGFHRLLSIGALLVMSLSLLPASAATVNASVGFNFSDGVANSLVKPGNSFVFRDNSELGFTVTANSWVGADWRSISAGTTVLADADYEPYGYSVAKGIAGLGVCGGNVLEKCLASAAQFGLNSQNKGSTEWLLFTSKDVMQFESLLFEPTSPKKGSLVIYSGTVDLGNPLAGINNATFTNPVTFDYGRNSGSQLVDLMDSSSGNALLIGAQGSQTAFTVQRMNATVVPIPSAIWLLGSAMLILAARARNQLT